MQANGKGILYGAVFVGGLGLVYLVFSMQARDEVKVEQKIQHLEKRIDDKKFDAEFDRRWDGKKVDARNSDTSSDEKELASLKADQRKMEADHDETKKDFADALAQSAQGRSPDSAKK